MEIGYSPESFVLEKKSRIIAIELHSILEHSGI